MPSVKCTSATMIVLVSALLACGASARPAHAKTTEMTQALIHAASYGNLKEMQVLLSQGADVRAVDEDGKNALVSAVNCGQSRSADFLLSHGISATDANATQALFTAVYEKETNIVKILLDHRANVNARRADGATPLMISCYYDASENVVAGQSPATVKLLLLHKADVNAQDKHGKTALDYLQSTPNSIIHKMLLDAVEKN